MMPGQPRKAGSSDWTPPKTFDEYRVLWTLGRGGMGEVYLGLDEQLGRQIAIKVLSRPGDPARISDRLQREALALACLAHPNVVAIHEVGEAGGQVFLVMERVDGATLRGWLDRDGVEWTEIDLGQLAADADFLRVVR